MELTAVLMAVRIGCEILDGIKINIDKVHYWTDNIQLFYGTITNDSIIALRFQPIRNRHIGGDYF